MTMEKLIKQSIELLSEVSGESVELIKSKLDGGCKNTENEVYSCTCALMAVNK